jgi:chromosome segregation ATPase
MATLGEKAALLQKQREDRKNRRTELDKSSAWPVTGPVPTAAAAAAAPAPGASATAPSRLENSVVQLLNIQIERLTAEVQKKSDELAHERERADTLAAAAATSAAADGGGASAAELAARTEELEGRLRLAQQRAEDAEEAVQRLRSGSMSASSAAMTADVQIVQLKEALRRKEAEAEAAHKELHAMQKDFQDVESLGIASLVEKDKLALENKSLNETVARQAQKLEALSRERHDEGTKVKDLSAELDKACQYTDAETARADAAQARVRELEEERERMAASAVAKNSELDSLNAMLESQKQRLESVVKQSDSASGQLSQQAQQLRSDLEQVIGT